MPKSAKVTKAVAPVVGDEEDLDEIIPVRLVRNNNKREREKRVKKAQEDLMNQEWERQEKRILSRWYQEKLQSPHLILAALGFLSVCCSLGFTEMVVRTAPELLPVKAAMEYVGISLTTVGGFFGARALEHNKKLKRLNLYQASEGNAVEEGRGCGHEWLNEHQNLVPKINSQLITPLLASIISIGAFGYFSVLQTGVDAALIPFCFTTLISASVAGNQYANSEIMQQSAREAEFLREKKARELVVGAEEVTIELDVSESRRTETTVPRTFISNANQHKMSPQFTSSRHSR